MPLHPFNKYRAAIEVLQRGRESLVDDLADDIVDQEENLMSGMFTFNELLETQGTRLHFLGLLISQLEQSADAFDEAHLPPVPPKKAPARRRTPAKKKVQEPSKEGTPKDV